MSKKITIFFLLLICVFCLNVQGKTSETGENPSDVNDVNEPETISKAPSGDDTIDVPVVENASKKQVEYYNSKADNILSDFVDDNGAVDFRQLRSKLNDIRQLQNDYAALKRDAYAEWTEAEKLSFWINVYNIQMLDIITRNYPIQAPRLLLMFRPPTDIRHINGLWTDYKFLVMDEEFTLRSLENQVLAKNFQDDPRVFLALYQGTQSGPPLRKSAYRAENLDKMLQTQADKFLSGEGLKIDQAENRVYLSPVFESSWLGKRFVQEYGIDRKFKDFEKTERAVLNFITNFVTEKDSNWLQTSNYSIKYLRYNWRLNDSSN